MALRYRWGPDELALVSLGVAAAGTQAVVLREAMSAAGGSELAWGLVLTLWFAGMTAGARLTAGLDRTVGGVWLPTLVVALGGAATLLLRAAPRLSGAAAGETLGVLSVWWLWAAAVLPPAVAGGCAFPILTASLREDSSRQGASGYALESAGAVGGGVLATALMVWVGTAPTLAVLLAVTLAACLRTLPYLAAAVAIVAAAAGWPADRLLAEAGWRWSGRPGTLARWTETRQQRLELAGGDPAVVYGDGRLLASFPDPYLVDPRTHLILLLHPAPERVLFLGAVADGAVVAALAHPIRHLRLVEGDPRLPGVLASWYGERLATALADPRVGIDPRDPVRSLTGSTTFDVIALLDGDPDTLRGHRTRSLEMIRACRSHLAAGGILVVRTGVGDTYLGGAGGRLLGTLAATLRECFAHVAAIPTEGVLLVAADHDLSPALRWDTLAWRWGERRVAPLSPMVDLLPTLLAPARTADLQVRLARLHGLPSTRTRPRAVLSALALREGRTSRWLVGVVRALDVHPPWPLAVALAAAVLATAIAGRRPGSAGIAAAAVAGFAGLGCWLLLLAQWQGSRGSVYAEVGALGALFMGGTWAGASMARRWRNPASHLRWVLLAGAAVAVCIAAGLPFAAPAVLVPTLLGAAGCSTGAAFAGAVRLVRAADPHRAVGRAFAADEAGAAAAAATVGLIALPWAGLTATGAGIAALQATAAAGVWLSSRVRG